MGGEDGLAGSRGDDLGLGMLGTGLSSLGAASGLRTPMPAGFGDGGSVMSDIVSSTSETMSITWGEARSSLPGVARWACDAFGLCFMEVLGHVGGLGRTGGAIWAVSRALSTVFRLFASRSKVHSFSLSTWRLSKGD